MEINVDAAVTYEKDLHLGVAASHDTKDLSGVECVVAKTDGSDKYWAGYNVDHEQARLGCKQHQGDKGFTHVYEMRYNVKKDSPAQAWGMPMTVSAGGKYVLSDKTTCNYMLEMSEKVHSIFKWEHKMDKNWKVALTQSFNNNEVGKSDPYKLGMDVTYQL